MEPSPLSLPGGCKFTGVEVLEADAERLESCEDWVRRSSPWTGHLLRLHSFELQEADARLPAQQHWQNIEGALYTGQIVTVQGSPGCGKSTQLPQLIAELSQESVCYLALYAFR